MLQGVFVRLLRANDWSQKAKEESEDEVIKHQGRYAHRTTREPIEAALAEAWERRNRADKFENLTTLDWLAHSNGMWCEERATQEEATLAATVIQWLGSPVGFGFLQEALQTAGYEIEKKKARAKK